MSAAGLISVRLPVSLLAVFENAARNRGISAHDAARRLLADVETGPLPVCAEQAKIAFSPYGDSVHGVSDPDFGEGRSHEG